MLVREFNVVLSPIDQDSCFLTIGDNTEVIQVSDIFPPANTLNSDQLLHNLRLAYRITNQTDPTSLAFKFFLNHTLGGIKLANRRVWINQVVQEGNGFRVFWGITTDDASYGDQFDLDFLNDSPTDFRYIAYNIGSRLRENGINSLTNDAYTLINGTKFRGFNV